MIKEKLIVKIEDCNQRLDQYLVNNLSKTRSSIQKLIKNKAIRVNDDFQKASYTVLENDVIEILYNEDILDIKAENIPLDIIYEDDDLIVINKKRGMVVHPGSGNYNGTLVNALLYHYNTLSEINGKTRPGIIHRIDKDTSGLIVCAKNDNAHLFISEQLKDKRCFRKYYALISGVLEYDDVIIDAPIGRSAKDRQKMAITTNNSKDSITKVKVLKRFDKVTLVECELETGRTHQIRVHCQYIKHAVVNDPKYGKHIIDNKGQVLHAHYLSFIHPKTKERVEFEIGMADYFDYYIKELNDKC